VVVFVVVGLVAALMVWASLADIDPAPGRVTTRTTRPIHFAREAITISAYCDHVTAIGNTITITVPTGDGRCYSAVQNLASGLGFTSAEMARAAQGATVANASYSLLAVDTKLGPEYSIHRRP
jgi:hypothetical protein